MTSLAQQLKRLALPQNDPSLLSRKDVASLLFDPKEAAGIDRDTFFALGCTGLEELLGIEPLFEEFQDTLFSPASKNLERSVQTKEVNQRLDAGISLFLTRLSPYFMLKPAQKCLEWLIHRFHIHLYNEDSLVACVLPYHETKVFVRVIQLLKTKDPTHRWNWLHAIKKPGVPLPRSTVITHCYKNLSFLDFICSLVTKSIKAYSGSSGNCAQLRVIFSFYASTIVLALDAVEKITDALIAKLLPYIQKGLKSPLTDYKAATYMIASQLAVKVVMEPALVNTLALQISSSLSQDPAMPREGLGCLIVLLQNQKEGCLETKACTRLCSIPDLISALQDIAKVHDISPVLRCLVPHLIHAVIADSEDSQREEPSENIDLGSLLESVLQNLPLENGLEHTAAKVFLQKYLSHGKQRQFSSGQISILNQRLLPFIRAFECKYPGALDSVLEGHLSDVSAPEEQELFQHFLSLSMSSGKYKILAHSDTSLLLSLNHPLPVVRNHAIEHLKEIINTGQEGFDEAFLREAVLGRVRDDVPEVVLAAMKALEVYADRLGPDETISCLLSLFQRVDISKDGNWCPVLKEAVRMLDGVQLAQGSAGAKTLIVRELLPFLVVTSPCSNSPEQQLATCVARCTPFSQHPLLHGWGNVLDGVMAKTPPEDVLGEANQQLISTMTNNLLAMDSSSKLNTIEDLIEIVRNQTSSLQERAAFLVLSYTLVQSLQTLDEPHHLNTALKIFDLLQPKLQKLIAKALTEEVVYHSHSEGCFPPGDLLRDYLGKLRAGDRGEKELCALLTLLLRIFIPALNCPSSTFRGRTWWNPERLDTPACHYLRLLCQLFDIIINGASQGHTACGFRPLMQLFCQVHLSDPMDLFKFLSLLWGYGANLGQQLGCKVPAVLQTQALYVGRALLAAQPVRTLEQLASESSPVMASLVVCLGSLVREVRRAALACLQSLAGAETSPFQPVIEKLLQSAEELIADPSHVSQILGQLFQGVAVPGKGRSREKKLAVSLEQLLHCAQDPECPSYTARGLLKVLQEVNGEGVLAALLPAVERLLPRCGPEPPGLLTDEALLLGQLLGKFDARAAALVARERRCLDLFVRALTTSQPACRGTPAVQILALEQITKPFFTALTDDKIQQRLLGVMFDLLVECRNPACAQTVNSVFKALAVDAEQVANELVPAEKPKASATVQQTRRQKLQQQRKAPVADGPAQADAVSWQRVTLILELLQHKKKLKRPQMLVPALFTLLSRCLEPQGTEQASVEYTKQLILSCLLNVCHKVSPDGKPVSKELLDEEKFNVELVVQCVRCSNMPQTHHHALLLLGAVAGMFPEKILHNIMPIFTFMGANIMRLDDIYSFQVINKTVQTVIPALIQAHEGGPSQSPGEMESVVAGIVRVFVDALPHVPEHRRLPILSQLVGTLGPERFLWVLLLLLFKQHATETGAGSSGAEKDAVLERDMEFWISVCCTFELQEQLCSLIKILQYLTTLPEDKEEAAERSRSTRRKPKKDEVEDLLFSVEAHSGKELRHFKFLSVSFMAHLLASDSFVGKVANSDKTQQEHLQSLEQSLLEEVLRYINSVAQCVEHNSDKPTAKFWRALLSKSYDVLDKVNALLPTDTFIPVMRGLMSNQLPSVRRKAMDLLNNKLQQKVHWEEGQVRLLLDLVGELLAIATHGRREEEEQAINRQTALYSLKLLCRCFGAAHQEAFLPVLSTAVGLVTTQEEERNVMGSALLCIAEVTSTLKALAIPQLPRLMPAVLQTLKDRKELLSNEIYLLSTVTALHRVCETLPHFVSPYLMDILVQVAHLTRLAEKVTQCPQLGVRLTSLKTTLATNIPPRVLLPTVTKCYNRLVQSHQSYLGPLMDVLQEHISHMERDLLTSHQSELTAFFLTALDFRAEHSQGDLEKTNEIEGYIIGCLLVMVMKLSEVTFRPLFFKLFDWSKTEGAPKERLLTFYRLSDSIAGRLKGLFILFAGHLVKPLSDLLNQTNTANADEALFDSEDHVDKSCLLLQYVLDCLHKIFLYDTQRFLSKERADALMLPLVHQLENTLGGEEAYQTRITEHLIPCIAQFSVALGDDSQWKPLNYQILLKTRHSSPKVRYSALLMLLELAGKLRENYMVLLPETIPFLAELMEDECEEVEHQVQKVIQQMEVILGEPLQSYF
ncbi:HEAT repeat-containing protein 1 isoform X1 [Lepisosteus oculatus]